MLSLIVILVSSLVAKTWAFTSSPLVVAHRGYSAVAPENTLPAFRMAWEAGAQGFETDLQFTKDGQLVVLHDATLDRTTNCTGYLSNFTYDEIKYCDASYLDGHDFSAFRGTRISLFSEVLALAKNLSMFVVMDYKSDIPIGPALKNIVPQSGMTSQVFGSCWKDWQIQDIGDNLPGAPKQILTSGEDASTEIFWEGVISRRVNGFSIQLSNITSAFVAKAHSRLLSVAVWTVNEPSDMKAAISYGVDAILTDDVPTLKKTIAEANQPKELVQTVPEGVSTKAVVGVALVVFSVTAGLAAVVFYIMRKSEYKKIEDNNNNSNEDSTPLSVSIKN